MQRIGTLRRKTRSKYKKNFRDRGKIKISRFVQTFKKGDKAILHIHSSYMKGMYHPRFFGKIGEVIRKTGKCYELKIMDIGKEKIVLVHPVHLKKL